MELKQRGKYFLHFESIWSSSCHKWAVSYLICSSESFWFLFFFVCLFFFCDRLGRVSANGAYLNLLLFRAGLSLLNTSFAQYWKASFWEWWWIFLFSCNSFLFASFFFIGSGSGGRGCKAGLVSVKIVNIQKEKKLKETRLNVWQIFLAKIFFNRNHTLETCSLQVITVKIKLKKK